jgi:hypothetical protein
MNDEYIIKTYFMEIIDNNNYSYGDGSYNMPQKKFIIYITNYGRLISSNPIIYVFYLSIYNGIGNTTMYTYKKMIATEVKQLDYKIRELYFKEQGNYGNNNVWYTSSTNCVNNTPEDFPLNIAPKLIYRMPKLFLDVIDAFHTQNNDLMQECCKKYLNITRPKCDETQIIDNIESDRIILNKSNIIEKQNKIIKERDITIEEKHTEIEKMKLEIAKLKTALSTFIN